MTFFDETSEAVKTEPTQVHISQQWKYEPSPLINCGFDPSGNYVFGTARDFALVRFSLADGTQKVYKGHESWSRGMAFTHDGQHIITGGCDDKIIWWNVNDEAEAPAPVRTVEAHKGWVRALAISPDGTLLASGGNDNMVRIWNVSDGALVREMSGHVKDVYSVFFHPSGEFLMSGDLAGQVKQWETATGNEVRNFDSKDLHTYNGGQKVDYGGVRSITMSPDNNMIAFSGLYKATNPLGAVNEPLITLFDWEKGEKVKSLVMDNVKGILWRAEFHREGYILGASGGSGGGVLGFWKPEEEKAFHQLKMPDTAVEMDLHPDGVRVATVHYDRHLRISRLEKKPEEPAKEG